MRKVDIPRLIEKLKKTKKTRKKLIEPLKIEEVIVEEEIPPVSEERIIEKIEEKVEKKLKKLEKEPKVIERVIVKEKPSKEVKEGVKEEKPQEEVKKHIIEVSEAAPLRKGVKALPKEVAEHLVPEELIKKLRSINEVKPLIKLKTKEREITFTWANVKWDEGIHSLIYYVNEPKLNEEEKKILKEIKGILQEKLDIAFEKIRKETAHVYLSKKVRKIIKEFRFKLTDEQKMKIEYYIFRDFIGLGKIEPFMRDEAIEDISVDGVGIPVFLVHRNPLYGELQTDVKFETKEELDSFVLKLAQRCGRSLSVAEPLLDGSLPDGSRIQATLGTDIARRGSNFSVRKFIEEPLTPIDLINFGSACAEIFAYLWLAIENRLSVLVAGPVATGKTTFLNCLSLFIKQELKIVSIEDTAEIKLPHPNWIPHVARIAFGREKYGEVTMFDLLKASLRQRPDYVIVGEVRGVEAYVLFQGMASIREDQRVFVIKNNPGPKLCPIGNLKIGTPRFSTISINAGNNKINILPVRECVKHAPRKTLYKITTKTGREVVVTGEHSVFTYNNGIKEARADELKEGDIIIIPSRLPSGYANKEYLDLLPYKLKITPELLRLIGYYIGDGSLNSANGSINMYNSNPKILQDMRKCIRAVTGKKPRERITYGYGKSVELSFCNKTIFELLKRFCGTKSIDKHIPEFIFGLDKKRIGHFIAALYSYDGHLRKNSFTYYTISKHLADDLLYLLLEFGIVASITTRKVRKNPDYVVAFYTKEFQEKFLKYAKPIGKRLQSRENGKTNKKIIGDIYLDKVKSIGIINLDSPEHVYDLCVPGTQNFVGGFGGILLHNTGHPALGTIHADDFNAVVDRLITKPINLSKALLENLDVCVFLALTRKKGEYIRRVKKIVEVVDYDFTKDALITNISWEWDPASDSFVSLKSVILEKIREKMGYSIELLKKDLVNRVTVLKWLQKNNIRNFKDVSKYFKMYYTNPKQLMKLIRGEK